MSSKPHLEYLVLCKRIDNVLSATPMDEWLPESELLYETVGVMRELVGQYQALTTAAREFHVSYLQASAADEEGLLVNADYEAYRALWRQVDETADALDHLLSNPARERSDAVS